MKALKELGQHFLNSTAIAEDIAALGLLEDGDNVWEIGAGKGILTDALLKYPIKLRSFELDRRLFTELEERYTDKVLFEFGDVLLADWDKLIATDGSQIKLIANIPYQITTPLLARLEEHQSSFSRIVMMVQKEVAERLSARSGTKSYAPLSIRLRLLFDISIAMYVDRNWFEPSPNVDSAVIVMLPRKVKPVIKNPALFHRLLIASFAHRRKTLANNLVPMIGKDKMLLLQEASQIDFKRRSESLDEADFIRLSDILATL
ncbi:MAG: 16S rRNA (adenine(1518)-N(6)/adenine(1519)-N(6))-dimethyltransferase RsmA [Candidatus Cloacimonetes bacterium]|nr:16S rRNA (adenine(1518)-N(6)/adenine(1519)-N(6))-dimethyltransferase RsmA [Candidatus Cloacimonadota bacterium]